MLGKYFIKFFFVPRIIVKYLKMCILKYIILYEKYPVSLLPFVGHSDWL